MVRAKGSGRIEDTIVPDGLMEMDTEGLCRRLPWPIPSNGWVGPDYALRMTEACTAHAPTLMIARDTRLKRLLRPHSVALIGGSACAEVIRQCRRIGFAGPLWPIHPRLTELEGVRTYRAVADLPEAPDAVFVAVNRNATIDVVRTLAARGAGGAVCYASGFAETDATGSELQRELTTAAARMPFIGPNCHGLINYLDGVALWPEQQGGIREQRGAALVTQSGNIALNLTMQTRGLPLSYVVTLGNQASITLADAIEALVEDARVSAIGLHIEGITDAQAFMGAAARAYARGVPLVAIKSGRSALGAKLGVSHTGSLGGTDVVTEAFLKRAGVVRVDSLPVLLESLKLLHVHGPLPGRDIASMSSSGGEAGLIADAGLARGLRFPAFTPAQAQRVAAALPVLASVTNPLDYHNFTWNDENALTDTYAAVMAAGRDLTLLVLDFPRPDRCSQQGFERPLRSLTTAVARSRGKAALVSSLPENLPEARARQLVEAGVAPLCGLEEALAAIDAAAKAGRRPADPPFSSLGLLNEGPSSVLSEWSSKLALAQHGLKVPLGRKVPTVEEAVAAAEAIGYPVALKSVGPAITHKTERGAVELNLRDFAAVRVAAAAQLAAHGAELLVEEMVTDVVAELIVGVGHERALGPYLMVGSGGIFAELLGDRRILLLPTSESEIREALASLRVAALLQGFRGRPAGDVDAAVASVLAIQRFATTQRERLLELDVNPLLVRGRGRGAVAADALIRLAGADAHA